MLTSLGKKIRILRINAGENSVKMASKLGITLPYLSAIENGKREIPKNFLERIFKAYSLTDDEKEDFKKAYNLSVNEIRVNMRNLSEEKKDLSLLYARKIENLDEESIKKIKEFLNEG